MSPVYLCICLLPFVLMCNIIIAAVTHITCQTVAEPLHSASSDTAVNPKILYVLGQIKK